MRAELARARYGEAAALGTKALEAFARTGAEPRESASTHASMALCALELKRYRELFDHEQKATDRSDNFPDAYSECAYTAVLRGDVPRAEALWAAAKRLECGGELDLGAALSTTFARSMLDLSAGRYRQAAGELDAIKTAEFDAGSHLALIGHRAMATLLTGDRERARDSIEEGTALAARQGGLRWASRLDVLRSILTEDPHEVRGAIVHAASTGQGALLELADVVASALNLLDPLPPELWQSIESWPGRWAPVLRRQLNTTSLSNALASARVLDVIGQRSDVSLLRAFERTYLKGSKSKGLGRGLARRLSPKLFIQDLGRSSFLIGGRAVAWTDIRRKAAALAAFLISRPDHVATKEQVLEALWPELSPSAAQGSLNQSLYFLRRDIEPWYEDGVSTNYVRLEGELVWIDRDIVEVASTGFLSLASSSRTYSGIDIDRAIVAFNEYRGKFAPEFEYDEWAMVWRDRVHACYLELLESLQAALSIAARYQEAIDVIHRALQIDPEALELHRLLVQLYTARGATAAAAGEYASYAARYRREVGGEPPPFAGLTASSR